ncbi:MAG: TRAP transporter fused permease subunit [Desulfobacterales bacterium]|nr:TRAP transporter fused permease subunit [Desulfobacterales bacterium]
MEERSRKIIDIVIAVVALMMIAYHMVSTQYVLQDFIKHQNTHLGFSILLVYLMALKKAGRFWPLTLAFLLAGVVAVGYVQIYYLDIEFRMEFPTSTDLVIGALLIIVVLEGTRRALGMVLTAVALIFIAYALLGHMLPRPFGIFPISLTRLVYELSTGFSGIYGLVLTVSADYVFLFVLLGGILTVSGGPRFIREFGLVIGRKMRGGPAMTAVIASSLIGSVTGSPSANIAITGSFTIPMMKQTGYRPVQAAAIEAAASTGGQIMPPVMSAAAFLMAGLTGISYSRIMLAALLPAVLYYLSVGLYVHFQAMKMNVWPMDDETGDIREILLSAPCFVVPLAVITFLFILDYSPMYVAFWGVIVSIGVGLIRKETRPTLSGWLEGFVAGATTGAVIGISSGCIGVMVKVLTMTGLGTRLPAMVETWSGGNLFLALIIVMIASLILGCGVPTAPAYIMVAIIGAPVLIKMGLTVLQAHFFVFYFAVMSMLTPPVAPAAVVSSSLAGSGFMKTAFEEIKPSIAGFLIPFMLIWCPMLLLEPQGSLLREAVILLGMFVAIICIQAGMNNYYLSRCGRYERVLFFLIAALLFLSGASKGAVFVLLYGLGLTAFALISINQWRAQRTGAQVTSSI